MRICELVTVRRWLPNHFLSSESLWNRPVMAVSEMELNLFYAKVGIGHRQIAVDAIDRLQASVILSLVSGELKESPSAIVLHELPDDPFLVDELIDGLKKMRPARRQACLFALETNKAPNEIMNLTWKMVASSQGLSKLSKEILQSANKTRHFALPYVFWEWATDQIATPLLELEWSAQKAFSYNWPELAARYKRIIILDRHAEAASFLELADQRYLT